MKIVEPHGAIIQFNWKEPTDIYIRGHVTAEAVLRYLDEIEEIAELRHIWARWYLASETPDYIDDYTGWTWHTRETHAPGWARVTLIEVREVEP